MRILIVTDFLSYGGVSGASAALESCLRNDGNFVTRFAIYSEPCRGFEKIAALLRAFQYLRSTTFDRIIFMHFEAIFVGQSVRSFLPPARFIYTIHTDLEAYYHAVSFSKRCILRAVLFLIKNDYVIFDSVEARQKSSEHFGLLRSRSIYNIVVQPTGASRKHSEARIDKCFNFGSVSRLQLGKNVDLVIRLFNSVWLRNKNTNLLIFGDGPELEKLRKYALSFPAAEAIFFKGYASNPDEIYSSFDALIGLSSMEGFGLVILEALARNVPVLHSDCSCGPREILQPNSNPKHKTNRYEKCNGGYLVAIPSQVKHYAESLQDSENDLLAIIDQFYEEFDEIKNSDFVDLDKFSAAAIGREWGNVLGEVCVRGR